MYFSSPPNNAVKEFLETAKEEFEEKWKNPKRVSLQPFIDVFISFYFSVQDFLDKAKKEFEDQWSKNPKVSFGCGEENGISCAFY